MNPAKQAATRAWLPLSLALLLSACGGGGSGGVTVVDTTPAPVGSNWQWQLPSYFPTPKVPDDNPMSTEKVDLGRHLFYDRRLSGNGTQACASCHLQALAFTDGKAVSKGSTGEFTPRSAQGLANAAYHPTLTWANKSLTSLEQQFSVPVFGINPVEMGITDANKGEVLQRIKDQPLYQAKFAAAFPGTGEAAISWPNITKAVASFQRSLISANSRYDQALQGKTTLSEQEQRGQRLFFGEKAECFHCHGSFNFNDQVMHANTRVLETPFHNTGLYNIGGTGAFPIPNRGLFEATGEASDMGRFRAPSLRNVALTAPYMHDGSIASLEEVLDFYAAGGRNISSGPYAGDGRQHPNKSSLVAQINLSAQDKADLVAFLRTLTDEEFITSPKHADPFK
ncbi:di-heme enzyme [Paucibacter sp. KBW04]|uniref:methanobactin export MATE transporter MbnM n=1 Tax=Paucibacter sp. KBW04 TaxID=2153361 RepID=UPI000F564828|nr:methanobactin export MATE transporter MbnM [Paucibacter sp. KBW04]RQO53474.1 di-heme enzyme [Paucibacter sp. KBW04]